MRTTPWLVLAIALGSMIGCVLGAARQYNHGTEAELVGPLYGILSGAFAGLARGVIGFIALGLIHRKQ